MHIWTSWGVLGCPRVSWGIKSDRTLMSLCAPLITSEYEWQCFVVTTNDFYTSFTPRGRQNNESFITQALITTLNSP